MLKLGTDPGTWDGASESLREFRDKGVKIE